MEILDFIILGLVQGLTEFLPVSSSGHLILAQHLLGINPPGVVAEVVLHLATLISVLVVYAGDLGSMFRQRNWKYAGALALATTVTVGLVLPFKDPIEALADSDAAVRIVGFCLLFTAILLFLADRQARRRPASARSAELASPGWVRAVLAGLAQAVAVLPGVSRSGSTIGSLLISGLDYAEAARFSFLMSIPVILGAVVLSIPDITGSPGSGGVQAVPLLAGFIAAALSGVLAIRFLLAMLRGRRLLWFALYCALVGVAALLLP